MRISRRDLLKGAAVAGATTALAGTASAREAVEPRPQAVGMLFDATLCVGCRACQSACKRANKLPVDLETGETGGQYDAPRDLNSSTKNVIKAVEAANGPTYMKQQCMHCVDPSCVSVCMMGALHKEGEGKKKLPGERAGSGIVVYDKNTCVGCRYCQIGCAFNVPKFEWFDAFPLIVKCELCRHRADPKQEGLLSIANPACCEVCPREAVVYGRREELLAEAKRRIAASPARYQQHVYGEKEGGGTQVLYLAPAGVSFTQLGLPELPDRSQASFSESVSHAPYLHGVTPVALYLGMAALIARNRKREEAAEHREEGK
ncbi:MULTISPECIES: hydrogenase 2 operon protein HybA [Anaeromyxobacter]|uniref:hydrogenase 2 operon protein HybA n=1 Tax=Anaeromyxobacter TaxID=161492 RepID=UPI001F55CA7C|nr:MULTISPECIES: hydrogenase 2 operon protein HybA [unclassified Anaeromyxobacter]